MIDGDFPSLPAGFDPRHAIGIAATRIRYHANPGEPRRPKPPPKPLAVTIDDDAEAIVAHVPLLSATDAYLATRIGSDLARDRAADVLRLLGR